MKKMFFNLLFIASNCFSDELILPENVDKIELERAYAVITIPKTLEVYKYIPENARKKRILEKKMNRHFINEVNKMELIDYRNEEFAEDFCHEIKVYSQKNLVAVFRIGAHYLIDIKNELFYYSEEYILRKYWNISTFEDCRYR